MLSAGNDGQFGLLCGPDVLNRPEWVSDERFATNAQRVAHRDLMIELITAVLSEATTDEWVKRLTGKGLPFAPINNIAQTFAHPQAKARNVVEEVDHPRAGKIKLAAAAVTYNGVKPKVSNFWRAPLKTESLIINLGLPPPSLPRRAHFRGP